MNSVVAGKRFRYFGADLNRPLRIQIQCQMAPGPRKTGGSNERPHLATGGRHELRELFWSHPTSNDGCMNRFRMRQFDFVSHTWMRIPNRRAWDLARILNCAKACDRRWVVGIR